jgi:hypothetical protein
MRYCLVTLMALSALAPVAVSAQQVRAGSQGSEPVLRIGDTAIPRPFGATLVDRLSVVGTQRSGGTTYTLVRGDVAGTCPTQYLVVARAGDGEPRLTAPFGTCAGEARLSTRGGVVEVSMPGDVSGGAPVRFRLDGGTMRPVNADGAAAEPAQISSCRIADDTDPDAREAVIADFERSYPAEYRRDKALKRAVIAPEEMRATVIGLACLATWPGAEEVVPKAATPLFASKRHGDAAFAALDAVAQDPASDANLRASARAFGAEMAFRVERREPL